VWRCPSVRFLDYKKVKDEERTKGKELFGTHKEPSVLASKVCSPDSVFLVMAANMNTDYGYQVADFRYSFCKRRLSYVYVEELQGQAHGQGTQEGRRVDQEREEFAGHSTIGKGA
jgi:hypothetical protein